MAAIVHNPEVPPEPQLPHATFEGAICVIYHIFPRELRLASYQVLCQCWVWTADVVQRPDGTFETTPRDRKTKVPDIFFPGGVDIAEEESDKEEIEEILEPETPATEPQTEQPHVHFEPPTAPESISIAMASTSNPGITASVSALGTPSSVIPDDNKNGLVSKPPIFSGDWTKVNRFLLAVNAAMDLKPKKFSTEKHRILFCLSFFIEGSAAVWSETYMMKKYQEQETGGAMAWGTYSDFTKEVLSQFQPENLEESALGRIKKLSQGSKTADEYIILFQFEASYLSTTSFHVIKDMFFQGINAGLKRNMMSTVLPDNMEGIYTLACQLDHQ